MKNWGGGLLSLVTQCTRGENTWESDRLGLCLRLWGLFAFVFFPVRRAPDTWVSSGSPRGITLSRGLVLRPNSKIPGNSLPSCSQGSQKASTGEPPTGKQQKTVAGRQFTFFSGVCHPAEGGAVFVGTCFAFTDRDNRAQVEVSQRQPLICLQNIPSAHPRPWQDVFCRTTYK